MQDIKELSVSELQEWLKAKKEPPFHARQIFAWIYKKGVADFIRMSDLAEDLRIKLKDNFYILSSHPKETLQSVDGTEKFLLELKDKNMIEVVSIPTAGRVTGCVSTQVGCKFSCRFCASGLSGFKRNLSSAEILEEVFCLLHRSRIQKLTHLVFMGTGEPLDNYDNVLRAIRVINSPDGFHIAARRITISSCGVIPGIKRLAQEGLQVELSISLHSADDKIRSQIIPLNKKYPLKELLGTCKEYICKTNRQITFEYILIKGLNSDLPSAKNLSIMLKGLNCKVNLIPANPLRDLRVEPPDKLEILLFKNCLVKSGIPTTLRRPRGQDIQAACGQLRLRYEKK